MFEIYSCKNFNMFFVLIKLKCIIFCPNINLDKFEPKMMTFYIGYTNNQCKCDVFYIDYIYN